MILLDTSVVSEPLRSSPDPHVVAWLDAQPLETLFLSVVTVAELRYGVTLLPPGRRRNGMITQMENQILPYFAGRVLNLDLAARHSFAEAMSKAQAQGHRVGVSDGFIAATAAANGLVVATHDTAPFIAMGLDVINPWVA